MVADEACQCSQTSNVAAVTGVFSADKPIAVTWCVTKRAPHVRHVCVLLCILPEIARMRKTNALNACGA